MVGKELPLFASAVFSVKSKTKMVGEFKEIISLSPYTLKYMTVLTKRKRKHNYFLFFKREKPSHLIFLHLPQGCFQ